jgi:hypothetical protein
MDESRPAARTQAAGSKDRAPGCSGRGGGFVRAPGVRLFPAIETQAPRRKGATFRTTGTPRRRAVDGVSGALQYLSVVSVA